VIGDDESPAAAGDVRIGGEVWRIASGGEHNCVLLRSGGIRCWGYGLLGRLGYGNEENIGDDETPSDAGDVEITGAVADAAAGGAYSCVLLTNGGVRCWGLGLVLGYPNGENIGDDETPSGVGDVDVGGPVAQLAAGDAHVCALLRGGAVRCWGDSLYGTLGYGNLQRIGDDETPASAGDVNVGGPAKQLAAGSYYSCALLETGVVRCWGRGNLGQLGYGNTESIGDDEVPAVAGDVNVGGPVARLAAGKVHVCALMVSGNVRCWGAGESGRLGYGSEMNVGDDETPASVGDVEVLGSSE
jgi:alpha-tubulin suppressor-like RCC1 family protein